MAALHFETFIAAPAGVCFDLNRDIDAHAQIASGTHERAVGGVTAGLIAAGQEVTWEGVHLGIRQRLTTRVEVCEPPRLFLDEMARGAFKRFRHQHDFLDVPGGTLMIDHFEYAMPLGPLGWLADKLAVNRHMRHMVGDRVQAIKALAESLAGQRAALEAMAVEQSTSEAMAEER